jgi:hypothetical protein
MAEGPAQVTDVHAEVCVLDVRNAPELRQELLAAEGAVSIANQEQEQIEAARGQPDLVTASPEAALGGIDDDGVEDVEALVSLSAETRRAVSDGRFEHDVAGSLWWVSIGPKGSVSLGPT